MFKAQMKQILVVPKVMGLTAALWGRDTNVSVRWKYLRDDQSKKFLQLSWGIQQTVVSMHPVRVYEV